MTKRTYLKLALLVLICGLMTGSATPSFAWGKRGHEIVAAVAARILEEKRDRKFLSSHEFDLGYYANVPDIIWRNMGKEINDIEGPQHYLDWNATFDHIFGRPQNLPLTFKEYKDKMGAEFKIKLGAAPYRIRALAEMCKQAATNMTKERQGPLLVCLGLLGHYTGDLAMPLHVTDNHDGQMTDQKGVHVYFEGKLVDALDPQLKVEVLNRALREFDKSEVQKMNVDQIVRWIISDSHSKIAELLNTDKVTDRKNVKAAALKFKNLIVQRLVIGSIITAKIWEEVLGDVRTFDEDHFYFFDGKPEYVQPTDQTASAAAPAAGGVAAPDAAKKN